MKTVAAQSALPRDHMQLMDIRLVRKHSLAFSLNL